jgi:hypothetical protein
MHRAPQSCWFVATAIGMTLLAYSPAHLAAQFGELPPGHIRQQVYEGVRGEPVIRVFVDSSVAARYVPAGLSITTLGAVATSDSAMARYLASHPELRNAVHSALTFVLLDSLRLDNGPHQRVISAAWWLRVHPTLTAMRPAPGGAWVEVASWSPDASFVRMYGEWPPLRHAPVHFERANDGGWRFGLTLADAEVRGRCRPAGTRSAVDYPLPAFTTVWAAGPRPTLYEIYTYHGHHRQQCVGEWTARGSNPLAVALNRTPADLPPGDETSIEDGWHARSARYHR